jgi:hypothetical protein
MNDFIKNIVNEEINKAIMSGDIILESKKDEKIEIVRRKLKALKNKYKNKGYSDKEALKKAIKKYKEKLKKRKEKELRRRKKRGGGTDLYDYKRYKELNRDVSSGDYKQLTDRIDQEKTDIAAVAREVFPKHTDEGAQSQLRKILNGERPMTNRVAQKLEDMISAGQIAVK